MRDSPLTTGNIRNILKQQKWVTVLIFSFIALAISLSIYFYSSATSISKNQLSIFEGRNFQYYPFELTDAHQVCLHQARVKFGDEFLRSNMDDLSSRFDERDQDFLVVLSVDVGSAEVYNTATIYCSINPDTHLLSYYKEVREDGSFLSQALRFFKL